MQYVSLLPKAFITLVHLRTYKWIFLIFFKRQKTLKYHLKCLGTPEILIMINKWVFSFIDVTFCHGISNFQKQCSKDQFKERATFLK